MIQPKNQPEENKSVFSSGQQHSFVLSHIHVSHLFSVLYCKGNV